MNPVNKIQNRLHAFIVKYYINALIKGSILFVTFGLFLLFFTLFIEYNLWLKPMARTILFLGFLAVEVGLLIFYILIPCFKIMGLQKGLNADDAAKIIGKHFSKVNDKLLNLVQLQQSSEQSALLIASIEQKATSLTGFKFGSAINFKQNLKYLKYLALPMVIILIVIISGKLNPFKQSLNRMVNYQYSFLKPAPFHFILLNKSLKLIEGNSLLLKVKTIGNIVPNQVEIKIGKQHFFLKKESLNQFSFLLENLTHSLKFSLKADKVVSPIYQINILRKPMVIGFKMYLHYPKYINRQDETINNTGNATIPEGTQLTWDLNTAQTTNLSFLTKGMSSAFKQQQNNNFKLTKRFTQSTNYEISSSNKQLKDFEKLYYNLIVVKDAFPKISVTSDIDSVQFGIAQFAGQISDDYGLTKLEFVYTDATNPKDLKSIPIKINKAFFDSFYFMFNPQDTILNLTKGIHYKFYFKVYDNDGINGSKYTKSQTFTYYYKTDIEAENAMLQSQKQSISNLQNEKDAAKKLDDNVKSLTDKLKSQATFKWEDIQQIKDLILRQKREEKLINNHLENLKNNLNQDTKPSNNKVLNEKKEALNKRIEETKKLLNQEKELDDLKKLAEKLNKEGLLKRLEKFNQQSKQKNRTLSRILELTRRFYIEKKLANIGQDLKQLSKKQDSLSTSLNNNLKKQEDIEKKFDKLTNTLKQLKKENKLLSKPMDLPNIKREKYQINEGLKASKQQLQQNNKKEAAIKQKQTAKKMVKMGLKMNQSMMGMNGEMHKENILTLQTILDNLIIFSQDQETLLNKFKKIDDKNPEFSKNLRRQQVLKDYFEHIDDSIYTLSLRLPSMTVKIQNDITETHYNINLALKNLAQNNIVAGVGNQQYAMTYANKLALILSQILDQIQNENPSMGKGKNAEDVNLPDIIKKQSTLIKKIQNGMKKGKNGSKNKDFLSAEQYRIYMQQEALKQALNELLKKFGQIGAKGNKAKKMMDNLEQQLIDKGFTNNVLQKMTELKNELLKLDTAKKKQGVDNKRKSTTNTKTFKKHSIKPLKFKYKTLNKTEILNRKPLLLKLPYQKRVQQYFKDSI